MESKHTFAKKSSVYAMLVIGFCIVLIILPQKWLTVFEIFGIVGGVIELCHNPIKAYITREFRVEEAKEKKNDTTTPTPPIA